MIQRNIFIVVLLFFIPAGWAVGQSYNFINYTISDGLVHDRVSSICTDHYGNLWTATLGGGISRFDGQKFENLTIKDGLASNYVRSILFDESGKLWAATAEGLSIYDGREFTNFRVDEKDENNSVHTLFEDREGNIWFSSFGGKLGKIRQDVGHIEFISFPKVSDNDNIIDIDQDSNGTLWFVSSIQGLLSYNNDSFTLQQSNRDLGTFILSIENHEEHLWIATNKGVAHYSPQALEKQLVFLKSLENIFVRSVHVLNDNNIWIVSASGIYNYRNGEIRTFTSKEGFSNANTNVILCDREGNLWFGTDGDGLYQLNSELFIHYNSEHGLSDAPITSIIKDGQGDYWFGTFGEGLQRLGENGFQNFDSIPSVAHKYISCSVEDGQGRLWFGNQQGGILLFDGTNFEIINEEDGFYLSGIRNLFKDSQNRIWIGTGEGLAMYDGDSFRHYTTKEGLYDNIIWGISEPQPGKILIVTREGFNYFVNDRLIQGYYNREVFSKRINVAVQDKHGYFWIGFSGHGIMKIHEKTGTYEYITDENGLHSNLIYNLMIEEKSGDILVGTERGVLRIALDEQANIERIKNYQNTEGFSSLQTLPNAMYQEDDGSLWFGTESGAFKYQPEFYSINLKEPNLYISNVKLNYNEVDWNTYTDSISSWFNIPYNLKLPDEQNNVVINYFGNSLRNPDQVSYRFRLIGMEEGWSPVTYSKEAAFTNLSPGPYRFEVLAANSDGIWNTEPAVFEFTIIPPFWQRPWFFVALAVYLIIMVTLYNNYRVRSNLNKILTIEKIRLEEQAKVRKRMARDFHDNMGNQLASITMFTSLISLKLKNRTEEVDQLLKNIEKHSRSLFTGTKDFIWSIDPESDDLDNLFTYIKDFGEEFFENTEISFFSDIQGEMKEGISLPSGWSRQLVLIFKEAMTNTLKHAQASEVYFHLQLKENSFVLIVEDNGIGIPEKILSKGNGLRNMKSRAGQIGGELIFGSREGSSGSSIRFEGQLSSNSFKNKVTTINTKQQQP
jgi:ligand-binding sensor domain-containing protein/signal transduction histidine kinase